MKAGLKITAIFLLTIAAKAFSQDPDSVVIKVGKESKVIFLIKDKQDLQTLKQYNFQALMDDMVQKLEKRDSTALTKTSKEYLKDTVNNTTIPPDESVKLWDRDRDDKSYN